MLERESSSLDLQPVIARVDQFWQPHASFDIAERAATDDRDRVCRPRGQLGQSVTRGRGQDHRDGLRHDRGKRAIEIQKQQQLTGGVDPCLYIPTDLVVDEQIGCVVWRSGLARRVHSQCLGNIKLEQGGQDLAGPAVDVVVLHGRTHTLHSFLAFGGRHLDRLVDRLGHARQSRTD